MTEIEWTRYSTTEWKGETGDEYEYEIRPLQRQGARVFTAFFNLNKPPWHPISVATEPGGAGVMSRLACRCQEHYDKLRNES
jgi:hypothetical protein